MQGTWEPLGSRDSCEGRLGAGTQTLGCRDFCHQFTVTLSQVLSFSGPRDPQPPRPHHSSRISPVPPSLPVSCIVTKVSQPGRQRKVLTKPVTHQRAQTTPPNPTADGAAEVWWEGGWSWRSRADPGTRGQSGNSRPQAQPSPPRSRPTLETQFTGTMGFPRAGEQDVQNE